MAKNEYNKKENKLELKKSRKSLLSADSKAAQMKIKGRILQKD